MPSYNPCQRNFCLKKMKINRVPQVGKVKRIRDFQMFSTKYNINIYPLLLGGYSFEGPAIQLPNKSHNRLILIMNAWP